MDGRTGRQVSRRGETGLKEGRETKKQEDRKDGGMEGQREKITA